MAIWRAGGVQFGENQKDSPGPRADGCWAPEAGEGAWLAAEVSLVIEDTRTMDNFTQVGECVGVISRGGGKVVSGHYLGRQH